jgi:hypothetical protein
MTPKYSLYCINPKAILEMAIKRNDLPLTREYIHDSTLVQLVVASIQTEKAELLKRR